ncbi:hypothetical protein SEA_CAMERICO_91 [Gordonia phage Camerico]|nr:hypothetical protein SEA_CAMERICO_91 [Gordonia phage Camerico]
MSSQFDHLIQKKDGEHNFANRIVTSSGNIGLKCTNSPCRIVWWSDRQKPSKPCKGFR